MSQSSVGFHFPSHSLNGIQVHDFDAGKGGKAVWRMTWNSSPFDPPAIAVGGSGSEIPARVNYLIPKVRKTERK